MINLFKVKHPQKRYIYAVTKGKYLGELLVFIDTKNDEHNFLVLPHMYNRSIPVHNFKNGIDYEVVEKIEKIPNYVFKVCQKQYIKNVEDNNIQT